MTANPHTVTPSLDGEEDDLSEITKMHAPRVDLVGGAAVGFDFLMAKADGTNPSMFTEDDVVALAKRAQEGDDMNAKKTAAPAAEDLTKADVQIDVNTDAVLEVPTIDAEGDAVLDPTSAAWEALDAARASQAIELTVALKRLVEQAIARESQEALVGDDIDDADNVWSLSMVSDDLDCILGVLAPFAVSEAAEAEDRETDDSLVLKSVDSGTPLGEGDILLKAGRVLSGVNEGRVQQAHDLLGEVLGSLGAPVVEDLTKASPSSAVVEDDTRQDDIPTVESTGDSLEKAEGDDQLVLVYGPKGTAGAPLGAVKESAITTFAPTPSDEDGDGQISAEETAEAEAPTDTPDGTDEATPADADQPAPAEMDADARTIPGTDTVQAPAQEPDTEDVKKGQHTSEVAAAVKEALAPVVEELSKTADLSDLVKSLKDRIDNFGRQPDDRVSPIRNGASGVRGIALRDPAATDPLADLKKAAAEETDPKKREAMQQQIAFASIRDRFTS